MKIVLDIETDALVNPKTFKERRRIWRHSKKFRMHERVIDKISECKRKGLDCDLKDENDLDWPDICPILKIPLDYSYAGKAGIRSHSPSLDRIDPSKGYLKDNIQVISAKANTMKNNASVEELKQFSNWINSL